MKYPCVIPRSIGDEESAFDNLLISANSGFLAQLGMTPDTAMAGRAG
jgi:hypothetical protein